MYIKQGQVFNTPEKTEENEHYLQTEEGKVYKVSETVIFVWDRLNGQTELNDINREIQRITEVEEDKLKDFSQTIVKQLEEVDLVAQV
ncbi:MAG: hypothetical protein CME65_03105 [Halobacteriovoraceae bacterium]|nr:hypothetical protein [Halobacteriovoraceae bacterium]|tara:strand:- start:6110 stop:6373 length:264 start_codon:yes stop_codon:yes gene_type:complete